MTTTGRRVPKYHGIAEDLKNRIRTGGYPPGSALPPQRELSASYGVTLATLRQALGVLEADGLLSQQPGRGTFVTEPKAAYQLDSLHSLTDDLRQQGHTVGTEIIGSALRPVPAAIRSIVNSDRVLRLERVRLLGGRPAIHQVSWIRQPYGQRIRDVDFSAVSLYRALADEGVVVHRASERLRPALLDAEVGGLLRQPAGIPVFASERTTYGIDDVAVVYDRATILGDLVEIRTERAATRLSMRWDRSKTA